MAANVMGFCDCRQPNPIHMEGRGKVCFDCGRNIPEKGSGGAVNRDKMPADVQREIARLRRIVNESLDRIQELMRAA